jgi:TolB-like protein/DNA-binding winged helix-turn-helix (wHTH) protein/tetratricopeptide (TPR) repeat protein
LNGDFQVGPWLVQPSLNNISQNGTSNRLEPKVMQVLVCLAEHKGEVVPKDTILQTVWPDTFVSDDVLKRSVSELRRAFEDDARESRIIETIPRRGYRLLVEAHPANGGVPKHLSEVPAIEAQPLAVQQTIQKWRIALAGIGTVIAVFGLLLAFNIGGSRERVFGSGSAPVIRSLAVLPLQNLSGDPAQEYFSDGMTEELITELARIKGMKVISRTSVMRYKNSNKSLPDIARELGADGIVEGSVLRSGDRVRITAQLISARTDANVWAETYDRDTRDVLSLQETVASAIAEKVKATMMPIARTQSKIAHTVNLKAHEAYLRGWHEDDIGGTLSNQYGMQTAADKHLRRAVEYYQQALREDPGFARAYLALAYNGWPNRSEWAARKALEIDDSLSDAHLILGSVELVRDRNWQGAEKELQRAIELNPSNAAAHQAYAYFLDAAGRLEEGMQEYQRAQELDPGNDHLGSALYSRRQFDRLIELESAALARDPAINAFDSAVLHRTLMVAYARVGRYKESIEEFRRALASYGYDRLAEHLRSGYARGGYHSALREWLKGVQEEKREFPFHWVAAYVHTELGERDAALAFLPKLRDEPVWYGDARVEPNLVTLRIEPMWDPLRSDPRFEDLIRHVGFPQ